MIKYKLECEDCKNMFDSWFSSSKEYEKLKIKKFLNCHFCNSKNIMKTVMAPNVLSQKKQNRNKIKKDNIVKQKILEFQKFIAKNFENVGDDFVYKARSLHYDNKKNKKGIYGNASKKQIKELHDEGIETHIFPWIDDKNN